MDKTILPGSGFRPLTDFAWLRVFVACGCVFSGPVGQAQTRGSLAGEEAAQALKKSIAAEEYNLKYGPVAFQTQAAWAWGTRTTSFTLKRIGKRIFWSTRKLICGRYGRSPNSTR